VELIVRANSRPNGAVENAGGLEALNRRQNRVLGCPDLGCEPSQARPRAVLAVLGVAVASKEDDQQLVNRAQPRGPNGAKHRPR
jgi:hypothetical protein